MKIIHTGDWHIGKVVNDFSMIEDQRFYLEKLVELIKEEKPDVFIIAGDIYDRSVPPAEAVELLDNILNKIIIELGIPVLAISGNHDSPERLSFGSKLLMDKGLYIEGLSQKEIRKVTLRDEHGNINFYLLPFVDPAKIRLAHNNDDIKTYNDGMKFLMDNLKNNINSNERNVLISHGYVTYYSDVQAEVALELCDSERPLSIGGTEIIDVKNFDFFNYVALGHLHAPQKVGSDKVRYSGSLLKYSASEWKQKKSISIIDLDGAGNVNVSLKQLPVLRDLRVIRGPLDELLNRENHKGTNLEDYIFAELTDEGEVLDAISKIRGVFPNIMGLKMINQFNGESVSKTSASGNFREKSMEELFDEFYLNLKGKSMDEDRRKEIVDLLKEVEAGDL